ncbi:MAG: hypothetical protein AAF644_14040, partial [Pseudomonadota bacterium]
TRLTALNKHSMSDPRADIRIADAFLEVEAMLAKGERFDTILIDLPDPNHLIKIRVIRVW